jgi:hypothetical protein
VVSVEEEDDVEEELDEDDVEEGGGHCPKGVSDDSKHPGLLKRLS